MQEDVLKLVELTEDIRRERRERIRELQWEREEAERQPPPKLLMPPGVPSIPPPPISMAGTTKKGPGYEERVFEREYIYDREREGGGGRRYR